MSSVVTLAVEGRTDVAVAKRLLGEVGLASGPEYVKNGKPFLDESLRGYNNAARFSCWLVLRDLDRDADCAPTLRERLLPSPAARMRLHIPVRSIEAWLLADAEAISRFLSIPGTRIPLSPESEPDPKRTLVDLARGSRSRQIRAAFVPAPGTTARVGPGYAALLMEFATDIWRPAVAENRSESLARLRKFLRDASRRSCEAG